MATAPDRARKTAPDGRSGRLHATPTERPLMPAAGCGAVLGAEDLSLADSEERVTGEQDRLTAGSEEKALFGVGGPGKAHGGWLGARGAGCHSAERGGRSEAAWARARAQRRAGRRGARGLERLEAGASSRAWGHVIMAHGAMGGWPGAPWAR